MNKTSGTTECSQEPKREMHWMIFYEIACMMTGAFTERFETEQAAMDAAEAMARKNDVEVHVCRTTAIVKLKPAPVEITTIEVK